jgi:hypothetical protein
MWQSGECSWLQMSVTVETTEIHKLGDKRKRAVGCSALGLVVIFNNNLHSLNEDYEFRPARTVYVTLLL